MNFRPAIFLEKVTSLGEFSRKPNQELTTNRLIRVVGLTAYVNSSKIHETKWNQWVTIEILRTNTRCNRQRQRYQSTAPINIH